MNYALKEENGILFLTLDGDFLGEKSTVDLMSDLEKKIGEGVHNCIVELDGLRYVNSSGLQVLLSVYNKFKTNSGKAIMSGPTEQLNKLFKITKLDTVFTVTENTDKAKVLIN